MFHLLEEVENKVGGLVELVVVFEVRLLQLLFRGQLAGILDGFHHGLRRHAAGLGGEVDTLSRALSDVPWGKKKEKKSTAKFRKSTRFWFMLFYHLTHKLVFSQSPGKHEW